MDRDRHRKEKQKRSSSRRWFLAVIFLTAVLWQWESPLAVTAKEPDLPPHLIQSVTEQDIFEGMLALDMLQNDTLEETDWEQAYELVKDCVVRVEMGNAYGSGIVYRITPQQIIIATNAHVLDYWKDESSFVYFPEGYYASAMKLGCSARYDVGFLAIDNDYFTYEELETMCYAAVDETIYDALQEGDSLFSVGADKELSDLVSYEGTLVDTSRYIEEFGSNMLYACGFAKAGMSGGGTFDGKGHLIGMISGGTGQGETASVPLPDMIEAYKEVVGDE